jgi:hypothetical protein
VFGESKNAKLRRLLADAMLDDAASKTKNGDAHCRAGGYHSPAFALSERRA